MSLPQFIQNLPQIVPESWCKECRICCRFPDTEKVQTPAWSKMEVEWIEPVTSKIDWFKSDSKTPSLLPQLKPCGQELYRCPAFEQQTNGCSIYPVRPLDCRLYPFVLTHNPGQSQVTLSMDLKCPYLEAHGSDPEVVAFAQQLAAYLERPEFKSYLKQNPRIVGPPWPEFLQVAALQSGTEWIQDTAPSVPSELGLQALSLDSAHFLKERFGYASHSSYSFAGLLGWSDLIKFWYRLIDERLCIFAEQAGGWFMPLPPLGPEPKADLAARSFELLNRLNQGSGVTRIEGIPEEQAPFYQALGLKLSPAEEEYLYDTKTLAQLKGDPFHSQRGAINKFLENSKVEVKDFEASDLVACLQLYTRWAMERQQAGLSQEAKRLIRDSLFFHRRLMIDFKRMHLTGLVLKTDGQVCGYTLGGALSKEVFCVFLEISDRRVEGAAQYLFREFCRRNQQYPRLNAMGDGGLPGLQQAKRSYRPAGFVKTFIGNWS